jgi:photosystem II stability/assembly factor-like uncharacterized protein
MGCIGFFQRCVFLPHRSGAFCQGDQAGPGQIKENLKGLEDLGGLAGFRKLTGGNMKRFIYTLIALLIVMTNLQAQWEILNEGVKGSLNAIDFINENVGWIGGSEGLLFKTQDGGQIWYPILLDKNWSINKIDFINDSLGWAIGNIADSAIEIIIKTTDGGENWLLQKKVYNCHMNSLFAVNDSVVYVAGERLIYKTEDGGSSWVYIAPKNEASYFSSYFLNSDTGIVAGSYCDNQCYSIIWKTYDGGHSWHELTLPSVDSFQDLQFIDNMTGYFISCNYPEYSLYETKDFGDSWRVKYRSTNPIISLTFINSQTAFAVMSDSTSHHNILKSTNGGLTWEMKFSISWSMNIIYFCSPRVGFLIGGYANGSLLRSVDSGDHWQTHFWSYPLHDVCFIDKDTGFACGGRTATHVNEGYIFGTHDGGKSWEVVSSTGREVRKCLFVNDRVGFALFNVGGVRRNFSMFKTDNGGKSWMDSCPFDGCDWFFLDEKTGWAVGRYQEQDSSGAGFFGTIGAGILMTIDQGENWELVWKYPDQNEVYYTLLSIQFIDATTGWAVGDCGLIIKRTALGQWEEQAAITDLPLNDVFFINEYNGFIAGGYVVWNLEFQTILFKTTNAGDTWEKIPDFPYLIHDIYFHDTQHGWAVGTDKSGKGMIVETRDGGDHWAVQEDSLIGPLNALSYRDGYLWAVGDYGLVLRTNLTTAVKDDKDQHLPFAFELSQNYPNPFNASTAIRYQLSAVSQVEMSIYSLLGQRIATLVSSKQSAGSYNVEWDGAEYSSGVYFCRMETRNFVKVIKLALVK